MVVVLHGGHGDAGKTADKTGFKPLADREGFLLLYPEAVEKHWNDGRKTTASDVSDVAFIGALVDHVTTIRHVDKKRVYVTGLSNGGMMTQRLACETPERYAAFASVIANMPLSMKSACKPGMPVAIMLINGTEDPLMPYNGGEIKKGRRVGMGGTVISVDETVSFWAENNHCKSDGNKTILPDKDPDDETRIEKTAFTECKDGSELVFYSVKGGGHAWPGSESKPFMRRISGNVSNDMMASEVIWEFFQRQVGR
jgi:polyhydroxybutyrate depolymerase